MYIITDTNFSSKNFVIHTFYDERTCFCWNQDKLIIFPYTNNEYVSVKVLTAPAPIKTIQCFTGRIFLICIPHGVYKLSRDREFAVLSKNAIGMGTVFHEVLIPRNEYLYLDNKREMTNKLLFKLSSKETNPSQLYVYPLNADGIVEYFMKTLTNNDSTVKNLCIIADGLKLLMLINENVKIMHSSIYSISNIIPVRKSSKIAALLLTTNTNVIILMHSKDNVLVFETIYIRTQIQAICAGFSQSLEDILWIVYSHESKLYYVKKQLLIDNIYQVKVEDKSFVCLQSYDSNIILGLTEDNQLVEFPISTVERTLSTESNTFINLHSSMLDGVSLIMDKIYKGTQELQTLNEILTAEKDKLRRINLYAHKDKIQLCPKMMINYIANRIFLSANFHDVLPKNSWVVLNVKLGYQNLFCMKKIVGRETIADIYIPENLMADTSQIAIDLIAFRDKRYPWCLIRNYVISDYLERRKKKKRLNVDFINSKIAILKTCIQEGNINMKKLSEVKKSLRKELSDI
ncbi:uncharacterized protein LOC112212236 isoform X1 [Bombus impatiens]|uniref:Uncharacterized protein LOC112212236 isoform X1 n=1 Tax=Bombus impatiens TaxID=132113 RepID=A0A6P6F8N1_BOMIM|nr:uncharacterized protein LOC112212236 isoform X1 [Bombus impatiens]